MKLVSMKDVFSNLEFYYYASGFQDQYFFNVCMTFTFKMYFCTFFTR